jgi:hypothetical protein
MKDAQDSPQRERILWLTVVRQAIWDAEGRGEVELKLIYRARKWLTKMTHSFLAVCSLAGMSETQAYYLQEEKRKQWPRK